MPSAQKTHNKLLLLTLVSAAALASFDAGAQPKVTIDRAKPHQTIDGFGFFGGMDVWWSKGPFHDKQWVDTVIDHLGLTIHRNEYYSEEPKQDTNWTKQKSLIQALNSKAKASKEPLKFIWTVWSPPSAMKSNTSLKNGGNLLVSKRADFGKWLIKGIDNYKGVGAQLYALSPQNEPLFSQSYNSCVYSQDQYRDMLKVVGPLIRAAYPKVKIFGPEHMLFGVAKDWDWNNLDPTQKVLQDPAAAPYLDIFACHGYGADGINPGATSKEAQYWTKAYQRVGAKKGLWMTETSGYPKTFAGALDYALSIHAALAYGNVSAWVHWQGSEYFVGADGKRSKKYHAARHYYRFVRPGATRVSATSSEAKLFVTAFDHVAYKIFTVVLINTDTKASAVTLAGAGLPAQLSRHQTTSADDGKALGTVSATATITLPAQSITTLVSGNVYGRLGSTTSPDAGPATDGATTDSSPAADQGPPVEAGAADGPGGDGSDDPPREIEDGCSCTLAGAPRDAGGLLLLLLIPVMILRRRP